MGAERGGERPGLVAGRARPPRASPPNARRPTRHPYPLQAFLSAEGLRLVIRSHEGPDARLARDDLGPMDEGYTVDHDVASESCFGAGWGWDLRVCRRLAGCR